MGLEVDKIKTSGGCDSFVLSKVVGDSVVELSRSQETRA